MLDQFRKRSSSVLIYLMFGMLIAVFAFSFGPGGGSCGGAQSGYAAIVDGEIIAQKEFALVLGRRVDSYRSNAQRSGMEFDSDMIEKMGLREQTINNLIDKKLLAIEAKNRGLVVGDDELVKYLKTRYGVEGVTYEQYENWIARTFRTTVIPFEDNIRSEILATKMEELLSSMIVVGEAEAWDTFQRDHNRVMVNYVRSAPARMKVEAATDEVIDAALAAKVDELKAAYEKDVLAYRSPKMVEARQIVRTLAVDADAAEVAKVTAALRDLKTQIEGGADFAALAKTDSQDAESAAKGGLMGELSRGTMAPNMDRAIFSLKADEFTKDFVRTEAGLHLIQVLKVIPPARLPFDEVKRDVAIQMLKKEAAETAAKDGADSLFAELQAGKSLEEVTHMPGAEEAELIGPERQQTPWVLKSQASIPRIGVSTELQAELFELSADAPLTSKVYKVAANYYVVTLAERETPERAKFDEEKKMLLERARYQKRGQIVRDWLKSRRANAPIELNPSLFGLQDKS